MRAAPQSFYVIVVVCCAVVLTAAGWAGAADANWKGAGVNSAGTSYADPSTHWSTAANWDPSGVPDPSNSAYLAFTTGGTVYGETSTITNLYLSSVGAGTVATFSVRPGDTFAVDRLLIAGQSSATRLAQSGGSLLAGYVLLGGSARYEFGQGNLLLAAGANLRGTLNMAGGTGTISAGDTTLVDLSHATLVNTSAGTYTAGANSLTIMHSTVPISVFGYFHTDGRIHTLGTTLSIAPGESLGGCGDVEDLVDAQGSLVARSWGFINLLGGVHVSAGGSVDLAGGTMVADGAASTIDGGNLTSAYLHVGQSGTGTFTQDGGQNTVTSALYVGQSRGSAGTYNLNGGSLLAAGWDVVGYLGAGSVAQSGGTHTAAVGLDVGFSPDTAGSYDLSGGLLEVGDNFYVGTLGAGQVTQTAGTCTVAQGMRMASNGSARGSYYLQGGHLAVATDEGVGDFGRGTFVQSGGSHTVGGDLLLGGMAETAHGTFQLGGGELRVGGNEWVGFSGSGRMDQTSGLHTVAGYLVLGASSIGTTAQANTGCLSMTGGSLTAPYVGAYGSSRYELSGGTLDVDGGLYVNKPAGTMELSGPVDIRLHDNSIAYLGQGTGNGQASFQAGAETLTVLPPGADPNTFFASFSSAGLVCNAGSIVPIPEGVTVRGIGELDDPVYCAGTMVARPGQFITLNAGARVGPAGSLNLGDADLVVNDTWSGTEGGEMTLGGSLVIGRGSLNRGVFDAAAGSVIVGGQIVLSSNIGSTGELRVGKDTYLQANELILNWQTLPSWARRSRVTVEIADTGNGLIHLTGEGELAGILDVQTLSGYRPKEGDRFTIITSNDPSGLYGEDFDLYTSNITTGLPGSAAFSGDDNGAQYKVTFLGYTAGDANGDHKVDGGDLALMGGNWMMGGARPMPGDANLNDKVDGGDLALMGGSWMMTGKSWGDGDFNGDGTVDGGDLGMMGGNWMDRVRGWADSDFNGDGTVDGGDLALMGGSWMWALPTPPPSGAPIPEPACASLVLGAGLALIGGRRRSRRVRS